jgi:hypothetical protein
VAKTGRFLATRKIDQFHELIREVSNPGGAGGVSKCDFSENQVRYDQGQSANQENQPWMKSRSGAAKALRR